LFNIHEDLHAAGQVDETRTLLLKFYMHVHMPTPGSLTQPHYVVLKLLVGTRFPLLNCS